MKLILFILAILSVSNLVVSCGGDGNKPNTPVEDEVEDDPQPIRNVTGMLSLNELGVPATSFHVLLFNHTTRDSKIATVDDNGGFSFPLNLFRRREVFIFYVLDPDYRYIAPIRFNGQGSAIQYQGGQGFNMEDLLVIGNVFGVYDLNESALAAEVVPGYQIDATIDVALNQLPINEILASLTVTSELIIIDELSLLEGLYRSSASSLRYQTLLDENSRFGINVSSKVSHPVQGIGLRYGGSWSRGAKFVSSKFEGNAESHFWETSGFAVPESKEKRFYAGVYRGRFPDGNEAMLFQVVLQSSEEVLVPSVIGRTLNRPPRVLEMAQGPGPLVPIDYASNGAETGLTVAVCRTQGDLRLFVEPPEASDGQALRFGSDVNGIDMYFTYFTMGQSSPAKLEVDSEDFPGNFSQKHQNNLLALANREWNPDELKLSWSFKVTGDMTPHELPIFEEVLLETLPTTTKEVDRIRVDIFYRGQRFMTNARFWLKNC